MVRKKRSKMSPDGYRRMYYMGRTDPETGIQHAEIYNVEVCKMKSGRYSVNIHPDDYNLVVRKYRYSDEFDFKRHWRDVV